MPPKRALHTHSSNVRLPASKVVRQHQHSWEDVLQRLHGAACSVVWLSAYCAPALPAATRPKPALAGCICGNCYQLHSPVEIAEVPEKLQAHFCCGLTPDACPLNDADLRTQVLHELSADGTAEQKRYRCYKAFCSKGMSPGCMCGRLAVSPCAARFARQGALRKPMFCCVGSIIAAAFPSQVLTGFRLPAPELNDGATPPPS
jgi:hypothetical protein